MARPDAPVDAWDASDALLNELLDEATNETDALLAELLRDEPAPEQWNASEVTETFPATTISISTTTQRTKARPRYGIATAARRDTTKHTLDQLRREASQLSTTLKRLESECNIPQPHVRAAMEAATVERLKRRRVEDECKQLRAAVFAQTQFLRGLRWSKYAALAQEARLQSAMDILCRETQKMSVSDDRQEIVPSLYAPHIETELMSYVDGFSMTSTNVYALPTDDLSAALRGVCVAVREIVATSQAYECVSRKKQIVNPDAALSFSNAPSILYRVMGVDHRNPRDGDELSIESRNLTLYKQTSDYAVLLEDFVDDDELHPQDETTNITRQVVGAYLLRRELCSDGQHHTVVRALRTRRYRFHPHTPPAVLQRYQQLIATTMKDNDFVFRGIIQQSIAHEERALAQAQSQLEAIDSASTAPFYSPTHATAFDGDHR